MFLSDSGTQVQLLLCKRRYSIHLFMLCATINLSFQTFFFCPNRLADCQTKTWSSPGKLHPQREKYLHACVQFLSNVEYTFTNKCYTGRLSQRIKTFWTRSSVFWLPRPCICNRAFTLNRTRPKRFQKHLTLSLRTCIDHMLLLNQTRCLPEYVFWLESLSPVSFFADSFFLLPWREVYYRTVIIVAFDVCKSIFAALKISKFNSSSLCSLSY